MTANSILILDDEHDIVAVFKKSLELAGYSVFGFTKPLLALEHFKANSANYALIITDIRMPAMNGIEFVKEIRKLDKDIAIIVMSAFDLKELAIDKEQEPELKIAELLDKPIMVSQLKAIVSKYLLAFTSSSAAIESSTRDTATGEA
jgi:two-component system C4-dicarboxylate transport response regulator DctD